MDERHDVESTFGTDETSADDGKSAADGERLAMLACSDCGREQPHRVRYRNEAVAEMRCTVCGRTIALPRERAEGEGREGEGREEEASEPRRSGRTVGSAFDLAAKGPRLVRTVGSAAVGLSLRTATKPLRLWRQVRREGADALKSLPLRAATKPLRLARELKDEAGRKMRELL